MSVLGAEMRKAQNNPVERMVKRSQYLRVARARKYVASKGLILQFEIKDSKTFLGSILSLFPSISDIVIKS